MRQKTVRDLHLRTAAILEEVAAGQTVVITRRGAPVAEIRPFRRKSLGTGLPDRESWLARFPQVEGDSGRFLEEDRS